jgi:hypothetical protein
VCGSARSRRRARGHCGRRAAAASRRRADGCGPRRCARWALGRWRRVGRRSAAHELGAREDAARGGRLGWRCAGPAQVLGGSGLERLQQAAGVGASASAAQEVAQAGEEARGVEANAGAQCGRAAWGCGSRTLARARGSRHWRRRARGRWHAGGRGRRGAQVWGARERRASGGWSTGDSATGSWAARPRRRKQDVGWPCRRE